MMKISTKLMMLSTTVMSTLMVLSSENWFSMWMGLEINMLSFIPLMEDSKNLMSSESKMIYFIIQSMASMMFLFTIIMNPLIMINESMINHLSMSMITLSMCMKIGMAPMHLWFINIMKKLKWNNCMMLMTWQSIAPLYIMSNTNNNIFMINILAIMSALIGAIGGINQTSTKKIMAYSSINHLGWMTTCIIYDNETWMKYLIIYSLMILILTNSFKKKSINFINQMSMNMKTKTEKMSFIMMMLSLGGLPPFLGFLPKWLVIQSLMNNECKMTIIILMMTSMITLFYYMRMITPIIMMNNYINKWNMKSKNMKTTYMLNLMINMMLPITMIISMT
uniref:NADH dehydrogenase subunit 2 n=1 Tax=Halobates calyptus TaxID=1868688 RepID=UPI001EDFD9DD|nr:NADH dehydrogenase subunit 2 [Halobates calyptus]UIG88082.1 NADH dehydrogenase subunit 2 [Halobates calyptus]UIG88194.1 NADH dehydrogenase subunit 2 [Halobates calyptus]